MQAEARQIRDRSFLETCSPAITELFNYWERCRGDRLMPRRRDIDPADFPHHLPGILLIDVEGETESGIGIYRYRVVGTREVENRGHDPTGKLVEEGFFAESLEQALGDYEAVRRDRSFLYQPLTFWSENGRWANEDSIILPLSECGEKVTQLLVYSERRPITNVL